MSDKNIASNTKIPRVIMPPSITPNSKITNNNVKPEPVKPNSNTNNVIPNSVTSEPVVPEPVTPNDIAMLQNILHSIPDNMLDKIDPNILQNLDSNSNTNVKREITSTSEPHTPGTPNVRMITPQPPTPKTSFVTDEVQHYRDDSDKQCWAMEYIWISTGNDLNASNNFEPVMRSKVRTLNLPNNFNIKDIPMWNYDGSSTNQTAAQDSEIILTPCAMYKNPFSENSMLVLCSLYTNDNRVHVHNNRSKLFIEGQNIDSNHEPWYGFEQEYILMKRTDERFDWTNNNMQVLGWPNNSIKSMRPQGPYYCSVGSNNAFGREIAEEHYQMCLKAKLTISGYNAEVMPGQWEYQIGPVKGSAQAGDELWLSRYILYRLSEKYNVVVNLHPKPIKEYNGSGLHTNFSTIETRQLHGLQYIEQYIKQLQNKHEISMSYYGKGNDLRLTGKHETSAYNMCKSGVGDRTAAIRIPYNTYNKECGYFEDRRPASNADPYLICYSIMSIIYNHKIYMLN